MSRHWSPTAILVAGALSSAFPFGEARGETQDQAKGQAKGSTAPSGAAQTPAPRKDEQAMAALKEMSTTLASARTMRFRVRSLLPMKAASGDWITLSGVGTVMRAGKDKLFVETGGDLFPFKFFFDGKTVTAFAPDEKVFAQKDAPGTIDAVLDQAAKRGEATFVFADVVSADPYTTMTRGLRSATVVGTSTIDGVETQHLAVHGEKMDWEIWIGTKDRLPRMVTLTDLAEARKPTHTVMFSEWALDESVPIEAFAFTPPPDATRVPFRDPSQAKAAGRRGPSAQGRP